MKYVVDTHTHTIDSGHAYSTWLENIKWASENGVKVLATTEHGPAMPGGPHIFFFNNLKVLPREMYDVIHLRGCEANIVDFEGNIDIPMETQNKLDLIIASLHDVVIESGTEEQNTDALLNVMENPKVDILGHIGNPQFPICIEKVIKKAKEKNKIIEVNNSSFRSRPGSEKNCKKVIELCKKYEVNIIVSSDSHVCTQIGKFDVAHELLQEISFPEELIMNTNKDKIINYLVKKNKLKDI